MNSDTTITSNATVLEVNDLPQVDGVIRDGKPRYVDVSDGKIQQIEPNTIDNISMETDARNHMYAKGCAQFDTFARKNAPAKGALKNLYDKSPDARIHQLRDKGWCIVKKALPEPTVDSLINGFNEELRGFGYSAQFGDPKTTQYAKNFPGHFWSIDTVMLPLQKTSIRMRKCMLDVMSGLMNIESSKLATSFDGTVCAASNTTGKAGPLLLGPEGHPSEMPCLTKSDGSPDGPTHMDQSRIREATAESNQAFCTLTKADYQEFSTVLFVPCEGWTLQGVRELLASTFPDFYDPSHPDNHPDAFKKRKRDVNASTPMEKKTVKNLDLGSEGHKIPKSHCDFLLHNGVCKVIKPKLELGDMLIWSSFIFHAGACYNVPGVLSRGPRLGIICAFCLTELISPKAQAKRFWCIGNGKTTGQQIMYPEEHPLSVPHCARTSKDKLPPAYVWIKEWRNDLKTTPLWMDRSSDGPEERVYRATIRQLLGMNDKLYDRLRGVIPTAKHRLSEWEKVLEASLDSQRCKVLSKTD